MHSLVSGILVDELILSFFFFQCNKKAKRSDIVVLYARTLKALDTSEQERMKRYRVSLAASLVACQGKQQPGFYFML